MIRRGKTILDGLGHSLSCGPLSVHITATEARVLQTLMQHCRAVTYDGLLEIIWNNRPSGPGPEVVKVLMCHIRRKLRCIQSDLLIQTVWGSGYVVASPDPPDVVCTLTQAEADALRRCVSIARRTEPRVAAIVEAAIA